MQARFKRRAKEAEDTTEGQMKRIFWSALLMLTVMARGRACG